MQDSSKPRSLKLRIMEGLKSERTFGWLMALPFIIVMLLAIGYPIATSLELSFTDYKLTSLFVNTVGMRNYQNAFLDRDFMHAVSITVKYTASAVLLEFLFGIAIAKALAKTKRLSGFLRSFLISPMFIAPIATGLIFRFLLGSYGPVAAALKQVGPDYDFFGTGHVLATLIGLDVWQWTPFMVLMLLSGLLSMPAAPLEAAQIDGARTLYRFFRVELPMLKKVIIVAIVLRSFDALRVFEYVFATTKGGPGTESVTLQYFIYQKGIQFFDLGYASALAFIVLVVVSLIVMIFARKVVGKNAGK